MKSTLILPTNLKRTILELAKFELCMSQDYTQQLTKALNQKETYEGLLTITYSLNCNLLHFTLQILHNLQTNLQSFNDKNNPNLKRVRTFKTSKAYLRKYHNHFETVLEVLTLINQEDVIKKDVIKNISSLFNNVQYDRDSVFEWLICDYLFYDYIQDKNLKLLISEKFGKIISDEQVAILNNIINKSKLYSKFFESYFMSLDLIESDFYKSAYIKLMRLYENIEDKGYKDKNPKNIILQILNDLGASIDLSVINTKDIYIKSIFNNIAILGSKKQSSLEGITKSFFNIISKYYNEKDAQIIVDTTIHKLLTH